MTRIFSHSGWLFAGMMVLTLVFASACKSSSGLLGGKKSVEATLKSCKSNNLDFTTMSISGKADVKAVEQDFEIGISYKINIYKDSLIWIKATKFGLEGGRVLITKDSIHLLNRLDRSYMVSDFSPAKDMTGLDASFETIQDLILGNFNPFPGELKIEDKKANPRKFNGTLGDTQFSYSILTDINKLSQLLTTNIPLNQEGRITYSNFSKEGGQVMPHQGKVEVLSPQIAEAKFQHRKVEINPDEVSFKFKVPANYDKMGK